MDRRERNIALFQEGQAQIKASKPLKDGVATAIAGTQVYQTPPVKPFGSMGNCVVTVSNQKSFQAAKAHYLADAGQKIAVLNFASGTNPGGGVTRGSTAQEEDLCRCSTLYPVLNTPALQNAYYNRHYNRNRPFYTHTTIYSPAITVFRDDTNPEKDLLKSNWFSVDMLTCAAPNLRRAEQSGIVIDQGKLKTLFRERAEQILSVAAHHGAEVLILGAFGCGAFRNDPKLVAEAFEQALQSYGGYFKAVEFAVYHRPYEAENYNAFAKVFAQP